MKFEHKVEYISGDLRFYVWKGDRVVQFVMLLGHGVGGSSRDMFPMARDLGYHSPVPMYPGHKPMDGDCDWTGGVCYYDGTSLGAAEPMRILQNSGDEKLFEYLEAHWNRVFEDGEATGFGALVQTLVGEGA